MRISTKQILMICHFKILKEEMKITLTIFKYAEVSDENKTDEKEEDDNGYLFQDFVDVDISWITKKKEYVTTGDIF